MKYKVIRVGFLDYQIAVGDNMYPWTLDYYYNFKFLAVRKAKRLQSGKSKGKEKNNIVWESK